MAVFFFIAHEKGFTFHAQPRIYWRIFLLAIILDLMEVLLTPFTSQAVITSSMLKWKTGGADITSGTWLDPVYTLDAGNTMIHEMHL